MQLKTHTQCLTKQPSNFGRDLISNIKDIGSFSLVNYEDPNKNTKTNKNFAKPVVDIAASSQNLTWLVW